jgi:hypothetical protein
MGLDMYAYKVENADSKTLSEMMETGTCIAEWRKHHKLFNWMHQLYIAKTGDANSDFNCTPVMLTIGDLDALEKEVKSNFKSMPIGVYVGYEKNHYLPEDLAFIDEARKALRKKFAIVFMGDY